MKLRTMSSMILILIGILLWKPFFTTDAASEQACPTTLPIRISALNFPPLVEPSPDRAKALKGVLGEFISHIIRKCFLRDCKLNASSVQTTLFNTTWSFLRSIQDGEATIAFPITRPIKMWLSDDDYSGPEMSFQEFFASPGYSLVMDVEYINKKANDIIVQSLMKNTWPIIVFTLLIAGISGIIVWILETYFNEEEFPRSFTKGAYEGFWWAFVSMTTVGYGDKTPKFIFGRLFGIAWILIGLVVIAVFTATATSSLNVSPSDLAVLEGTTVGVLNVTSAGLEAKQRGAIVKEFPSAELLFRELESNIIDGIFMDKFKAGHYLHSRNKSNLKVFLSVDTSEAVKYYLAVLGVSANNLCFKSAIMKRDVDKLLLQYLKPVAAYNQDSDSTSIFSGASQSTQRFLLITMGVFLCLVLLGIIGELVYKTMWKANKRVENSEDGIELKDVKVQSNSSKGNLKDIEDKLGQLVREVRKLQEQLVNISSQANGTFVQSTTHM